MNRPAPRIIGVLVGDIKREPGARVKYGYFFDALRSRFDLTDVLDASLRGADRWWNAATVFHPNKKIWKERFSKNIGAFQLRSRRVYRVLQKRSSEIDVILQVGVLFDSQWTPLSIPSVIYTDYTAQLSAEKQHTGRSPFSSGERRKWIDRERAAFQKAAHIYTRSAFVRRSIMNYYGIEPTRITIIGGGVNLPQLPELQVRNGNHPPTALFIGKEFYRKGGDLLLNAFAQTRRKIPGAKLLLLTSDAIPPGLPMDGVERIQPTWDRSRIEELFRAADVFILPSRQETWGDVLLEAMAYGLACIGVSGEAMGEIIQNGKTGFVVPQEDVDALAAALSTLLDNALLRTRMGYAGRSLVEERYTWPGVVEQMAPSLESITGTHSPPLRLSG